MYLVLVRHGQAEKARENQPDAERSLTEAGIRATKANLRRVFELIPAAGDVKVITSPYLRARQTAEIAMSTVKDIWGQERLLMPKPETEELLTETTLRKRENQCPAGSVQDLSEALRNGAAAAAGSEDRNAEPDPNPEAPEQEPAPDQAPTQDPDQPDPAASEFTSLPGLIADELGFGRSGNPRYTYNGRAMRRLDGPDRIVMLVGHDPQMSRLGEYLTGLDIKFSKGSAMCVELSGEKAEAVAAAEDPETAERALMHSCELRWFVGGPDTSRWQTLVDVEKIFRKRYERVEKYCRKFRDGIDDADTVHDMRVAIRTLRSLLTFIEPFQKHSQNRRLQKDLRGIVRELSRLREYDVLIDEAERVGIDFEAAGEGIEPPKTLDAALSDMREEEYSNARAAFSKSGFSKLMKEIGKEIRSFEWRGSIERNGLSADDLERRLTGMSEQFLLTYRGLDFTDAAETHKVRKNAKKVRYAASVMKPLAGEHRDIVEAMKRVQDRLGRLCDVRVNAELLEEIARKKGQLSEVAMWQAQNLAVLEREDEKEIIEALGQERGGERNG
jgi:CHAD domain-containing protein/phosphohistidine phosphatase SixA